MKWYAQEMIKDKYDMEPWWVIFHGISASDHPDGCDGKDRDIAYLVIQDRRSTEVGRINERQRKEDRARKECEDHRDLCRSYGFVIGRFDCFAVITGGFEKIP